MKELLLFVMQCAMFAVSGLMLYIAETGMLAHDYIGAAACVICALIPIKDFLPRLI